MSIDMETLLQALGLLSVAILMLLVQARRKGLDSLSTRSLRMLFCATGLLLLIFADYAFFGDAEWPRDIVRGAIAFVIGVTLISAGIAGTRAQLLSLLRAKPDITPAERVRKVNSSDS